MYRNNSRKIWKTIEKMNISSIQQSNEKRKARQKRGKFITHSIILAAVKNVKRLSLGQRERNILKVRRAEP